ncbi:hypothetical protein PR048_000527 [Dryococelus australis]|uniref:Uncharacterized protein n=1 Tax=Dryococelus australis TaxID=614101 RepID=A0ABQ9IEW7_9NEOP|nr:hypothetical protein PR048_000527 [Dryococelus australis]
MQCASVVNLQIATADRRSRHGYEVLVVQRCRVDRSPGALSWPGSMDFRKWESCRTMPLVGGFSRGSPVSPTPSFRRRSMFTSITPIDSEDLDVKSRPNPFALHAPLPNSARKLVNSHLSSVGVHAFTIARQCDRSGWPIRGESADDGDATVCDRSCSNAPATSNAPSLRSGFKELLKYIPIYATTRKYLRQPMTTRDYLKLPVNTRDYLRLPTTRDYLRQLATTCDYLPQRETTCHYKRLHATTCDNLRQPLTTREYLRLLVITYDNLRLPVTNCDYPRLTATNCDYMLSGCSAPCMRHGPSPVLEISLGLATTQRQAVLDGGRLTEFARAKYSVADDWRLRDDGENTSPEARGWFQYFIFSMVRGLWQWTLESELATRAGNAVRRHHEYSPCSSVVSCRAQQCAGMKGREKREFPEKTNRPAPARIKDETVRGATSPGNEPGSPRREASSLTTTAPFYGNKSWCCFHDIHGDSSPFLLQPFHELSNGFWPRLTSPQPPIQFVPKMFYRVEVGALGGPVQSANIVVGVPLHSSP